MKSNYKPIGNFIHRVEKRNKDLKVTKLLGLSMTKEFRETTSNTVGTNMSVYRVMSKYQFACDFMSPIRVNKLPVVLKLDDVPNLVSPAYPVFEVNDRNELNPEYLMMWFRRPEFDRYATFKCDAAIRGGYDWEALCETLIPVPSIEKQREIVKEYNTVIHRIELNKKLNQKLEETAQALYKHWFVDFEFPNEEGKPYKSNGGAMVFNEELDKGIPVGWEVHNYEKLFSFKTGKLNSNAASINGVYPFFTCSAETFKTNTYSFDCEALLLAGNNASAIYPFKYFKGKFDAYQRTYVITPLKNSISIYQAYFEIINQLDEFKGISSGTATKFLTMKILNPLLSIYPNKTISEQFHKICSKIFERKLLIEQALEQLNKLNSIILSKMTKVETEKLETK
ncbi:restriction endonuclease subunit S [Candidatus Halobeggiatoa sp. HSG11]|nr:restriction endonuclease subunit S [Candidatus Halobeggiatoa sp. HSG11]